MPVYLFVGGPASGKKYTGNKPNPFLAINVTKGGVMHEYHYRVLSIPEIEREILVPYDWSDKKAREHFVYFFPLLSKKQVE